MRESGIGGVRAMDREIGMGRETEMRSIEELLASRDDQIDGILRVVYVVCNKEYVYLAFLAPGERDALIE